MTLSDDNMAAAVIELLEDRARLFIRYVDEQTGNWVELCKHEAWQALEKSRGMYPDQDNKRIRDLRDAMDSVYGVAASNPTDAGGRQVVRICKKVLGWAGSNGV